MDASPTLDTNDGLIGLVIVFASIATDRGHFDINMR